MESGTCGATAKDGWLAPCWTTKTVAISSTQKLELSGISHSRVMQAASRRASSQVFSRVFVRPLGRIAPQCYNNTEASANPTYGIQTSFCTRRADRALEIRSWVGDFLHRRVHRDQIRRSRGKEVCPCYRIVGVEEERSPAARGKAPRRPQESRAGRCSEVSLASKSEVGIMSLPRKTLQPIWWWWRVSPAVPSAQPSGSI